MTTLTPSKARAIRQRLNYPVIDADGHLVEFLPPIEDYVKSVGGSKYAVRFLPAGKVQVPMPPEWYWDTRSPRLSHWGVPAKNTLDRATAALPKLLYERLDDLGFDFTVLFPTMFGFEVYREGPSSKAAGSEVGSMSGPDPEVARVRARANNMYRMDLCREYADRMTPVADIPMQTPQEGIEELEFAVQRLGYKVVSINSVRRPIPALHRMHPDAFPKVFWLDSFGLDSAYDYDPFWAKCVELRVPVMSHGGALGWPSHNSPTQFVSNHMGHFGLHGETLCKSLFIGGVTRRFPDLRFGFMEGGVAWGARLYNDLLSHWDKRNREAMQELNPANLDRKLFADLHTRYGRKMVEGRMEQLFQVGTGVEEWSPLDDDFAKCRIERPEDMRDLFVPSFFFGCEADDRLNGLAFDQKFLPYGARLGAVLGSDIGHWDVPDMTEVLPEAYELLEDGILDESGLRDLLFSNPVKLFAGMNPDFFKGTVVESAVQKALSQK